MTKNGFKAFDSDIHISEPNFWAQYIDPEFKDQAPQMVPDKLYREQPDIPGPWMAGYAFEVGGRIMRWPAHRSPHSEAAMAEAVRRTIRRTEEAVDWSFDTVSQLQAMDKEGLDQAAVFPTHGLRLTDTETMEPKLAAAIARAYNDWLYDFCSADRERLIGVAMVTPLDIEAAVQETRRAVQGLGFREVFLRPNPLKGRNWYDPYYDPLWAELERLDVPVAFHAAATTAELPSVGQRFVEYYWLEHAIAHPGEMMLAMAAMIGGGVLARFPKLRVAFLEGNCSWLPFFLWRMDRGWDWIGQMETPELKKKPSEYFSEGRCFVAVESEEDLAKETIERVGDDCLVFSTDYPHLDSEYPHAVEIFLKLPISTESKRKILWDNCRRLYGLN